jgi:hypothetical protein
VSGQQITRERWNELENGFDHSFWRHVNKAVFGILTSIIVGLGNAHLLRGLAELVQHPGCHEAYWLHLLWDDDFECS